MKSEQELRDLHDAFHEIIGLGMPRGYQPDCVLPIGTIAYFLCVLTDCKLPNHARGKSSTERLLSLAQPAANEKLREKRFRDN